MSKRSAKATKRRLKSPKKLAASGPESQGRTAPQPTETAPAEAPADALATGAEATLLARIDSLETDRTNLMAQVAWARAVAQEQQKTLEVERERAAKLTAELDAQRARVEQLKALSALDRLLGRHKGI